MNRRPKSIAVYGHFVALVVFLSLIVAPFQNCGGPTTVGNPIRQVKLRFAPYASSLKNINLCMSGVRFDAADPAPPTNPLSLLANFINDYIVQGMLTTYLYKEREDLSFNTRITKDLELSSKETHIADLSIPDLEYNEVTFVFDSCVQSKPSVSYFNEGKKVEDEKFRFFVINYEGTELVRKSLQSGFMLQDFINELSLAHDQNQLIGRLEARRDFTKVQLAKISSPWSSEQQVLNRIHVKANGKVLAVGGRSHHLVAQFDVDGSPDLGFGNDLEAKGVFHINMISGDDQTGAKAVAEGPNDEIYIIGSYYMYNPRVALSIVKLSSQGLLDERFGQGGIKIIQHPTHNVRARGIQFLPDGSLLLIGTSFDNNENKIHLAKVLANSELDLTFGDSGFYSFRYFTWEQHMRVPNALQGNKLLLFYDDTKDQHKNYWHIERRFIENTTLADGRAFTAGDLDPTFNPNGSTPGRQRVLGDFYRSSVSDIVVQQDNSILISGSSSQDWDRFKLTIFKLNENGEINTGFGNNGMITFDFGSPSYASGLAIGTNGEIYVGGLINSLNYFFHGIVAFSSDGQLMLSKFNSGSKVFLNNLGYSYAEFGLIYSHLAYRPLDNKLFIGTTTPDELHLLSINP